MSHLAFGRINPAMRVQHLPRCRYGCGEMLVIDDGYQCPVCNYYRNPDYNHPARRRI